MPILEAEQSVFPLDLLARPHQQLGECSGLDSHDTKNDDTKKDREGGSLQHEDLLLAEEPRRWWTIYTKSRQEKALARQLLQFEIPFYLPLVPKENLIRGKRVESYIPLFQGYMFLLSTEVERVKTLTTNRVSRMLPVEDGEQLQNDLRQIQELIDCEAPLTVEKRLEPGETVRIKSGPLMGLEGTITRRQGVRHLIVAVKYLQQGVSVQIDDFMVEKL